MPVCPYAGNITTLQCTALGVFFGRPKVNRYCTFPGNLLHGVTPQACPEHLADGNRLTFIAAWYVHAALALHCTALHCTALHCLRLHLHHGVLLPRAGGGKAASHRSGRTRWAQALASCRHCRASTVAGPWHSHCTNLAAAVAVRGIPRAACWCPHHRLDRAPVPPTSATAPRWALPSSSRCGNQSVPTFRQTTHSVQHLPWSPSSTGACCPL